MEPIVIDDFLSEVYQNSILNLLTGHEFPWIFYDHSVNNEYGTFDDLYQIDEEYKEHIQMRHIFARHDEILCPFFQYIAPLLGAYNEKSGFTLKGISRIKANLLISQPGIQTQLPHADGMVLENEKLSSIGKKTLLYYVDDSDGDTIFYDKYFTGEPVGKLTKIKAVKPKKGRAIIFDSNQLHAGSCPKESKYRMVINCVFNDT
jgi:hypothetical protein